MSGISGGIAYLNLNFGEITHVFPAHLIWVNCLSYLDTRDSESESVIVREEFFGAGV